MTDALDKAKLAKLIEIEGYDDIVQLIEAVFSDSVSPALCTCLRSGIPDQPPSTALAVAYFEVCGYDGRHDEMGLDQVKPVVI